MDFIHKPADGSYPEFYKRYLDQIDDLPLLEILENEKEAITQFLENIPESKAEYRYEPGKWSVKESIIHLLDSAYIFTFRALCISRGEQQSLPGFDQDAYMESLEIEKRSLEEVVRCFLQFLELQINYAKIIGMNALNKSGIANKAPFQASTILYISAAHNRHHLNILKERYHL